MKLSIFRYYLKSAFDSLKKNALMSIASISTVSSCIFILILSFMIASNIDNILENIESSSGLSVFLNNKLKPLEISNIYNELKKVKYVSKVEYITKARGLKKIEDNYFKNDESILEGLEEDNPLLDTFDVYIENIKYQNFVVNAINTIKQNFSKELNFDEFSNDEIFFMRYLDIDMLINLNHAIRIISVVIISLMSIISVTIVINTIKITVNSRKKEISIMKYIGATEWFIRWPFLIEGMIIGVIGSLIPIVISFSSYYYLINLINTYAQSAQNPLFDYLIKLKSPYELFIYLSPASFFIGILIGYIGSFTSIKRYLVV